MRKLIIRQTCVPGYRRGFFDALAASYGALRVIAGDEYFTSSVRTIADTPRWLIRTHNRFHLGRRLAWLCGAPRLVAQGDVFVHELNPRILSLWRDLLFCRRRGAKFLLWGHATGRDGARGVAFRLRHWIVRLADGMICYTESQAELARALNPDLTIIAAPNACMRKADFYVSGREAERDSLIYVGRLVEEKKIALLLNGFAGACRLDVAFSGRLVIVGDGPDRRDLEKLAEELGVAARVDWMGQQEEICTLRSAYERAFVSVLPGSAGLTLLQAFAFGIPVIMARNEPHGPEIEAAEEGVNAHFFASNDASDLAEKLLKAWAEWRGIEGKRKRLSAWTAETYSFEKMAERFCEIAERVRMR